MRVSRSIRWSTSESSRYAAGRCGRHGHLLRIARGQAARYFPGHWLAVKTKLAEMPEGAGWKMLFAVACLGGIGFTMSIFVDTLAFADAEIVSRGKIAILMGSFASAVLGTVLIFLFPKKDTYMKKYRLIAAAGLFLLGACSRGTGSMELRNETDSVAYVIGLNVGYNLQRMDSTLNVEAVCQAVRDVYARTARMTPDEARAVYLRYVNVSQPEQIRAYEEQFLEDFRKSNRSYAKTDTGLTYEVLEIGDESKTPRSDRDTVAIRFVAKTVDGKVVESSYERGDTTRTAVGDLMPGLRQSVRLVGEGGRMNVWIPSRLALRAEGDKKLGVVPNATLFYEIELVDVR